MSLGMLQDHTPAAPRKVHPRERFILEHGGPQSGKEGQGCLARLAQGTLVFSRSGWLRACMLSGAWPLIVTVIHA